MSLAFNLLLIVTSLMMLCIGWWLGQREKASAIAASKADGRAESSIEHARLTERIAFLERSSQERDTQLAELQSARDRGEQLVAQAAAALSEQREIVSGLTAQLQAERRCNQDLAQRGTDLIAGEAGLRAEISERDASLTHAREECSGLRVRLSATTSEKEAVSLARAQAETDRANLQSQMAELSVRNAKLQTELASQRTHADEKLAVLQSSRDELTNQFKTLSAEILEEKSRRFTEQNAAALSRLLGPFQEQFNALRSKVDEVYRTDGHERAAFGEQLKQIIQLNQTLSADAQNLTRALKGDPRTQGTLGEIVLDTVLEQAGLIEGTHYDRQTAYETDDQKRAIPDIVIRLPADRQLVVDSKVSLTAYERSIAAVTTEDRDTHIRQHLTSLRNHIRLLSEKNYQQLYQLKSLDFVLLFVPLEPAFSTAVSHDNLIFREAWDRNVILVSPSTLLFVVRTVAYLWRQESQARNVIEIAKRGAFLYDKLCGFVEDLQEVGKRIRQTAKSYDSAMSKLTLGGGNLISQAETLRDLGIKPSKQLPMNLIDRALSKAQQSLIPPEEAADTHVPTDRTTAILPANRTG